MDFGKWIQSVRKERRLDMKTVAERSGVETSTISRVENSRTQVSLSVAVRLCEGLELSASDLFQVWRGRRIPELEWKRDALSEAIPTINDVEVFLQGFHRNREEGKVWLSELLNRVVSVRDDAEGMPGGDSTRPFVSKDIHKLLFDSPVYRFELQYPPGIEAEDLLAIYKQGGAMTLADIGEYLKKVRREKRLTLARLENAANISASVISRLETGSLEQVKLEDILMLDEQLEQEGKLLAMYWRVCSFNGRVARQYQAGADQKRESTAQSVEQEVKLASLLSQPAGGCST